MTIYGYVQNITFPVMCSSGTCDQNITFPVMPPSRFLPHIRHALFTSTSAVVLVLTSLGFVLSSLVMLFKSFISRFNLLLLSFGVLKHGFWSSQFSNSLFLSVTLYSFVSCWAPGPNSWNGWRVTSRFKSSTSTTAVRCESVLDSCRWMVIVQRTRPFFNFTAGACTPRLRTTELEGYRGF